MAKLKNHSSTSIRIGSFIRQRRKYLEDFDIHMTQVKLAQRINVSPVTLARVEKGRASLPLDCLPELLKALRLNKNDWEKLFDGTNQPALSTDAAGKLPATTNDNS